MSRALALSGVLVVCAVALVPAAHGGTELAPIATEPSVAAGAPQRAVWSSRTLSVGIQVDRDGASLVSFTSKPHPFVRTLEPPAPRAGSDGRLVQLELVLVGPDGRRFTHRVDAGPICLAHAADAEPHVAGDTILLHRDAFPVELPWVAGFDRVEVARYDSWRGAPERRALGTLDLTRDRYRDAPGAAAWDELRFSDGDGAPPLAPEAATVLWPEAFGDPDVYRVWGDEAAAAERINVVLVPDGYTYAQKDLMEQHADAMVQYFRGKTPYAELDGFINYTLVYAYSAAGGTDQCDCGIVLDTAMGTRFPNAGDPCGGSGNRCLYYGSGCDTNGTANIIAAEQRAPFLDTTVVMVNTARYGGCGGSRAVYSAANASASDIAVHELGHSLAGLADEYAGTPGCGGSAGEINTSTDSRSGAWKEWLDDLGSPREGAQYYNQCIYRPADNCEMRALGQPFCPVCNQRWSLFVFGYPSIAPTAPLTGMSPDAAAAAMEQVPTGFSIATRFAQGPQVTNQIDWTVQGPSDPAPVPAGSQTTSIAPTFSAPGTWEVRAEVTASTNFIKPLRYGSNVDEAVWTVDVVPLALPGEVSPPGSSVPLRFDAPSELSWEDASPRGAASYNLYRVDLAALGAGDVGSCFLAGIAGTGTSIADLPAPGSGWGWLVTGANALGEGPAGAGASGASRSLGAPCGG